MVSRGLALTGVTPQLNLRVGERDLLVRLVIHEQIDRVIRVTELKGAGDGFVEALSTRRCLAHVVQYSAQLSLIFAGNRKGDDAC